MVTRNDNQIHNSNYPYQQSITSTYFTLNPQHFQRKCRSYQNFNESHLLNRHVSDQCIAKVTKLTFCYDNSYKNVNKQCSNITFTINEDTTNNDNISSKYNNNYRIHHHNQQNFHNNTRHKSYLALKENPLATRFNEKFRSSSLPPLGNNLTPQKSIIGNTNNLSPSLVNPFCSSHLSCINSCYHNGADWEDCRINIECFSIKSRQHCKSVRHQTSTYQQCTPQQLLNQLSLNNTNYILPLSRKTPSIHLDSDKHLVKKPYKSIRSHSLCARSVRLSIIPLNPIYKRSLRRKQQTLSSNHQLPSNTQWINSVDLHNCQTVLRNCWRKNLIQRMAFKIDDFTIQEDQVKVAKDVFKRFDKRGQEKISTTDLGPAFRALNLTVKPDTLKEWADQVDDDATGFIDFNGFLICYGKKLQEDQDERDLRDAFRVLDKNKRGEIDVEDLR
ncbi:20 kDa calcium-binding protein [Schistosoma japonicum]|nr:20 kDa calcium-binding protein [Schistosoma japonicum]